MKRTHVSFFTNVDKTQIIDNGKYFELRGVPVTVDDAVMNGLLYSAEHNEAGMPSLVDRVVTLSHPTDKEGNGQDAYTGNSLMEFYGGGTVVNVYSENAVRKADIRIKKNLLKAQDESNGTDFYERLDNKKSIGVSTGLYTLVEEQVGTNAAGQEYRGVATNQQYNHLAMLTANEPPAGGDATYMHFNSEDTVENMVINVADYMPESTYTRVEEEKPESGEDDDDKDMPKMFMKLLAMLGFAKALQGNYNVKCNDKFTTDEEMTMAHYDVLAKKLGMNVDEVKALTGEQLEAKLDKVGGGSKSAPETNSQIEALSTKIDELTAKLEANANAEKSALVNELKDLEIMPESALNKLDVDELKELKTKHGVKFNHFGGQYKHNGAQKLLDDEMPE